jgi:hypothetical protein
MMDLTHNYYQKPQEPKKILGSYRTYTLYGNGLYKTVNRDTAIEMLRTKRWYDKTRYQPKEEVLTYEEDRQRIGNVCIEPQASSEREEPRHESYQCDEANDAGEKHISETVRTEQTDSVLKKRGRPKAVK